MSEIPLLDLVAQYQSIKSEIDQAMQRVLDSGWFILGDEVDSLECEIADHIGVKYGVGVASGTDALILSLRALDIGPGDEVILPTYTFFATVGAVLHVGATPVLVDIDPQTYCIDVDQAVEAVTPKTRAVVPVHLYGHPADLDPLVALSDEYDLKVIEDNAQAFGARYQGQKTGSIGDVNCLSFFPSKNLGGYGDGGMVLTDSPEVAEKVRRLRVHGWKKKYHPEILGYNSRLDAIQAAILRVKLKYVDQWNERRQEIARIYSEGLSGYPHLQAPQVAAYADHVFHLYVIQSPNRDHIRRRLQEEGIASGIYYPLPLHLTEPCSDLSYQPGSFPVAEKASQETLAIPIYPELTQEQIVRILSTVTEASEK